MYDQNLFALNAPLCRKFYFLNLIILALITVATYYLFDNVIKPAIVNEAYVQVADIGLGFVYFILFVTLLALYDRRIYDIFGSREAQGYQWLSSFCTLTIVIHIFIYMCENNIMGLAMPVDGEQFVNFSSVLDKILLVLFGIIGLIKGKLEGRAVDEDDDDPLLK